MRLVVFCKTTEFRQTLLEKQKAIEAGLYKKMRTVCDQIQRRQAWCKLCHSLLRICTFDIFQNKFQINKKGANCKILIQSIFKTAKEKNTNFRKRPHFVVETSRSANWANAFLIFQILIFKDHKMFYEK